MEKLSKKLIKYPEGQWFAVPLKNGGYALGIIVRGQSKTKGGLGYFFGPKHTAIPTDADTLKVQPAEAITTEWFGDLGIMRGDWPLIVSSRPFHREEWPVPKFGRVDAIDPTIGWLVEYAQDDPGTHQPIRRTLCKASELIGLPRDWLAGFGAIEIGLTQLLDPAN